MEFVDYKCLESLLIEGEELIATEGFIDTVKKKITDFFRMIGRMITNLISIIKAKFNKSSNKQRYENSEQSEKFKTDFEATMKRNAEEYAKSNKEVSVSIVTMINIAATLSSKITDIYISIELAKSSKNGIDSLNEKVAHHIEQIEDAAKEFYSIFNKINDNIDNYYVSKDYINDQDRIIRKLEETKARIDKTITDIDKDVKENKFDGRETLSSSIYSNLTKSMGKVTSIINDTITIINKIEFR